MEVARNAVVRVWLELPGRQAAHPTGLVGPVLPDVGVQHPGGPLFITVTRPDQLLAVLNAPAT
jgi:hypothetical protein